MKPLFAATSPPRHLGWRTRHDGVARHLATGTLGGSAERLYQVAKSFGEAAPGAGGDR
jgi:hypothetical protein